jgi:DNA-binding NtrC family response regulator/tetratricopeptide (TPR) repeat protein
VSSAAAEAARRGYFKEAARLLVDDRQLSNRLLRLEIEYYLGNAEHVHVQGPRVFSETKNDARFAFRAASILASQYFDDGRSDRSLDYCQQAVQFAERSGDLEHLAAGACTLLERTCVRTAFDTSLPLALLARRASIRCGRAAVSASTHLTFGRLEARAGRFNAARRHFTVSRSLLASEPNLLSSASLDLDESSLHALLGDTLGALEMAKRAVAMTEVSGWSKGIVAAAANCAFLSLTIGDLDAAKTFVQNAAVQSFQSPSYNLALDETKARLESVSGNPQAAEALLREHQRQTTISIQPWYQLSAAETLIRLLAAQGRWKESLEQAERALNFAKKTGTEPFIALMELARAHALLGLGVEPRTIKVPVAVNASMWSPSFASSLYQLLGRALVLSDSITLGRAYLQRSARILEGTPSMTRALDANDLSGNSDDNSIPRPDLDSAVALIELGGHTHILAREALAVIDAAQCARGVAIIASSGNGPKVIDRRGWDEPAALAVARKPASCEVIPLGEHRDEPWQLIVYPKPELEHRCSLIAIRKLIAMALTLDRYRRDEQQRAALWPTETLDSDPESIWSSEQMSEVLAVARRIAPTTLSVLLTGETGTGKEMLARAIHRASDRCDRPMIPFNCTAVPRDMIESQLFGYRRGAFTGADASFAGVIRSASGGTLFLDEIADVPLDVQPKLLRFLETHEIHPLGETQPVKVDVRVIAATNARLEQLVAEGRFREDLFYRLNVVHLKLPPLRERREEIPPLVEHYLRKFSDEQKKGRLTLADETLEYLLLYAWPGNLRQLANEVRRIVAMAEADATLTPTLLSPEIQASRRTIPATSGVEPEVRVRIDQPLPAAVELLEQTMVKSALDKTHGRVEEAARILGISRKGLFLKRRRWGLSMQHH